MGFLSYTRASDQQTEEGISELRRRLESEVRLLSGENFVIFQDKVHIRFGQNWKDVLDQYIRDSLFFFPVVTAGFLKSRRCRDELLAFCKLEQDVPNRKVIFPIYYSECGLDTNTDEVSEVLKDHQYADWRQLRLLDSSDQRVKTMVEKMAQDIISEFCDYQPSLPVNHDKSEVSRVVIFTHFCMPDDPSDILQYSSSPECFISSKWGDQIKAVNDSKIIKLMFIFIGHAYAASLVDGPDQSKRMAEEHELIEALEEFIYINGYRAERFVLFGYDQLRKIIDAWKPLIENCHTTVGDVLLAQNSQVYYDTPKIIEALVRIARREYREPILRFDEDVIINDSGLSKLISEFERGVKSRRPYFFFSGNYLFHSRKNDSQRHFINDYAVRLHFLCTDENGEGIDLRKEDDQDGEGVKEIKINKKLATKFMQDLFVLGYEIRKRPISGAGLYMSIPAIEQLPPFANMSRNITWIDDGIKWSLHVGLGDISLDDNAVVRPASFQQRRIGERRGIKRKDVKWAVERYLPRLVRGIIMDRLMYDFEKKEPGVFAQFLRFYMLERKQPCAHDFHLWANECRRTLSKMQEIWTSDQYNDPAGLCLRQFRDNLFNRGEDYSEDLINICVTPETTLPDISAFLQGRNVNIDDAIVKGGSRSVYIAQTICDLRRYVNLLEIWPYLCRSTVFMMRKPGPPLSFLDAGTSKPNS